VNYSAELPPTADVVILGGGIVGAATAFHAARAGLHPVIVEARPALCTLTTPVAAGAFRLQFDSLEELTLVRESVELFLNFQEITRQNAYDPAVSQQGYLWLATTEATAAVQRDLVSRLHRWGQTDVEILGGDEARRRFPYVGDNVLQARFRADDGFVDTKQVTFGLAEASGATVVLDCRAVGFDASGGRLRSVETSRGIISTDLAVIACGPLSRSLAEAAGLRLPVVAVRRHKLWVPGLPLVPPDAPMTIDEETAAHWRPAFGGAWVLFTDPSTPPEPPAEAVPVDPAFAFQVLDPSSPGSVARVVPFWRQVWEHGAHHWTLQAGQYTVTPDHRPLLGPTSVDGLHVNTGYSGHGIMAGPAGSRLAVDLVIGKLDPATNPFAPDRTFEQRPPPTL
jgi:glycine/D-amino acid oxidase-like deaminating enzyme